MYANEVLAAVPMKTNTSYKLKGFVNMQYDIGTTTISYPLHS